MIVLFELKSKDSYVSMAYADTRIKSIYILNDDFVDICERKKR